MDLGYQFSPTEGQQRSGDLIEKSRVLWRGEAVRLAEANKCDVVAIRLQHLPDSRRPLALVDENRKPFSDLLGSFLWPNLDVLVERDVRCLALVERRPTLAFRMTESRRVFVCHGRITPLQTVRSRRQVHSRRSASLSPHDLVAAIVSQFT